jgi:peptide subunit release factor RF-3
VNLNLSIHRDKTEEPDNRAEFDAAWQAAKDQMAAFATKLQANLSKKFPECSFRVRTD